MELKLTNEEIARVLGMYINCEAETNGGFKGTLFSVRQEPYEVELLGNGTRVAAYKHVQLLLTPLDKITDEDAIEVAKILGREVELNEDLYPPNPMFRNKPKLSDEERLTNIGKRELNSMGIIRSDIHQYLISKGYALPLYFSPNHPCNGKTAIELGIAIDKTINK